MHVSKNTKKISLMEHNMMLTGLNARTRMVQYDKMLQNTRKKIFNTIMIINSKEKLGV